MAKKAFSISTELTARIDDLTSKLNTANKRVGHFKNQAKQNKGEADIFKNLVGGIGKFLPAIGLAALAQKTFMGAVKSSQITSDAFDLTMGQLSSSTDLFHTALANLDFKDFLSNLSISNGYMRELIKLQDLLGDVNRADSITTAEENTDLLRLRAIFMDNEISKQERLIALEEYKAIKQQQYNRNLEKTEQLLEATMRQVATSNVAYMNKYGDNIAPLEEFIRDYGDAVRNGVHELAGEAGELRKMMEQPLEAFQEYDLTSGSGGVQIRTKRHSQEHLKVLKEIARMNYLSFMGTLDESEKAAVAKWGEFLRHIQQMDMPLDTIGKLFEQKIMLEGGEAQIEVDTKRYENSIKGRKGDEPIIIPARVDVEKIKGVETIEIVIEPTVKTGPLQAMTNELLALEAAQINANSPEHFAALGEEIDNVKFKIAAFKGEFESVGEASRNLSSNMFYGLDNSILGANNLVNAFQNVTDVLNDVDASGWDQFMAIWNAIASSVDTVMGTASMIEGIIELTNRLTLAKEAEALASSLGASATVAAKATETGAITTKAAIEVATTRVVAGAYGAQMAAATAAAYAPLLLAGIPLAAAQIAAYEGMILAASIPKFEVGGVVGGSSFTGDKILAGVNSGERILTAEQNKIFEGLAKQQGNGVSGNVTFEIRGDKLMGVLDNYNNRSRSYG